MLVVALAKGSLLSDSIARLYRLGLDFRSLGAADNRFLQMNDPHTGTQALLVRNQDVPVYVARGQAHLGIVGYDVLRESQAEVAHLADLGFGHCRMSVAMRRDSSYTCALDLPAYSRVATKFSHCAREFFTALDLPVELVPLAGSVELGPITGMAEAIVDLVATGRTLRDNGLVERDVLFHSTARLIAHPLSYRLNQAGVQELAAQLEGIQVHPADKTHLEHIQQG
ncbi:ATP phosphoribosyltransferase [Gloeomargarita lithophora Alchichica-D10]|uniref:ATP phosphoribosyltransferase n=1 Tax=Gloeomargarita lithophora Alchichica-D10 TaxID=1188229 RepID=A0A1J0AFT2_9CYAN|nr:ATP phosphoribosyltransferase [Gloeomargarita lithophora]APB34794.1 ATP phosphoribosyltransferase [Gloeomargarita lithophora Alchichica-D10]